MAASDTPVLVLVGATATGKTAVAVEVALRIGGEVISADSRAFFRGPDIVTAKPTVAERADVPHHLIDCVPLDGTYDAMTFRRDVERLIPEIRSRGRVPILAGGGTLYLRAVLGGIFEGPSKDDELRARLDAEMSGELHERLRAVDPVAAEAIHPNDRLRLVRALEVFEATGRPISQLQSQAEPLSHDFVVLGLRRDWLEHREAIAERTRRMIDTGLVDEVRRLLDAGLRESMQAYRTIGIPEAVAHVTGETSIADMEEAIVRATWALVRRQSTWFRREPNVEWLDVSGRSASDVAAIAIARWEDRVA